MTTLGKGQPEMGLLVRVIAMRDEDGDDIFESLGVASPETLLLPVPQGATCFIFKNLCFLSEFFMN